MFATSVRYSGLALGNNLAAMTLGGTAPFLATFLVDATGSTLAPAGFFVACGILTFGAALTIKETKGIELSPGLGLLESQLQA